LRAHPESAVAIAGRARCVVEAHHTIEARIAQLYEWMHSDREPDFRDMSRPPAVASRRHRPATAIPTRQAPTGAPHVRFPILSAGWATTKVDDLIVTLENWPELRDGLAELDETRAVVCWGAGLKGRAVHSILRAAGVAVSAFIDTAPDRDGSRWDGLLVRTPASLAVAQPKRPFVVVTSLHAQAIGRALRAVGYRHRRDWIEAIG
jgi:hypothetical protein